ncbi:MAG: hypothetical protein U0T73_12755 [Chitinophagales bacterium]
MDQAALRVLQTFSSPQLKNFRKYLTAIPLNGDNHLVELLDALMPVISGKSSFSEKLILGQKLLQSARKGSGNLMLFLPELRHLAEGFLSKQYQKQSNQVIKAVTPMLQITGLDALFRLNYQLVRKAGATLAKNTRTQYLEEYLLQSESKFHEQMTAGKARGPRQRLESIEAFYLTNTLRYACAEGREAETKKTNPKNQSTNLLAQAATWVELLDPDDYHSSPEVQLYYHIYRMLHEDESAVHFKAVKALLFDRQKHFEHFVLRDGYVFAINYCIQHINGGAVDYLKEIGELYVHAAKLEFLFDEWELQQWNYAKFQELAHQLKDYNWSEKLVESYSASGLKSRQMNAVTLNLARAYVYRKKYDLVVKLLRGATFHKGLFYADAQALLAKAYFELGDMEALHELISQVKKYFSRKKKRSADEVRYLEFFNLLQQIGSGKITHRAGRKLLNGYDL